MSSSFRAHPVTRPQTAITHSQHSDHGHQSRMVNAEAGPSRSGASEPAAPPSTAGHWPLGTKVKVLVDPHSKSSSQDKEPILRVSTTSSRCGSRL